MKQILLSLLVTLSLYAEPTKKLPAFSFDDIDGTRVSSSDFKGKVLILDFWATWCLSCKKAIPVLNSLSETYASKGLVVIGMNTDSNKRDKVLSYLIKNGIGYQTLLAGNSSRLAEELEVVSLPMLYVFDRKGNLVTQVQGFEEDDKKQLLKAISTLMK